MPEVRLFGPLGFIGLGLFSYVAVAALAAMLFVGISYALAFGGRAPGSSAAKLGRAIVLELWATFVLLLQAPLFPFVGGRYVGAARGTRPVLLLHGFVMTRAQWLWLGRRITARGLGPVYGMTYFTLGSVEGSARKLGRVVQRICAREKVEAIDIVGHSLGGIVARYYADHDDAHKVARLVTLGSPHRGTRHSRFAFGILPSVRDLDPRSEYLHLLFADGMKPKVPLVSIWSRADAIVVPPESASVAGVGKDVVFDDVGHLGMLLSPQVVDAVVESLS